MTTIAVRDVGFCADFSLQGDWAFDYALSLSRSQRLGLKVFYVPDLAWEVEQLRELPSGGEITAYGLAGFFDVGRSVRRSVFSLYQQSDNG